MTREEASRALDRLAHDLPPDLAGLSRLLERVAVDEQVEALRDALAEMGARAVLDRARSCS